MEQHTQADWSFIIIALIIAGYFAAQGTINIQKKRLTSFGMDRLMFLLIRSFSSTKTTKNMEKLVKRPEVMQKTGRYALYISLGFVLASIRWYIEYVLPFVVN